MQNPYEVNPYEVNPYEVNPYEVIHINQEIHQEIHKYIGSYGEYYNFHGVNYDIRFPIDWVFQTQTQTQTQYVFGPYNCKQCFIHGYHNGVFIGYCESCANICNYERGYGMILGEEKEKPTPNSISIWDLYLQNVSLEEIGDLALYIEYRHQLYHTERPIDNTIEITFDEDDYDYNNNDNDTVCYNDDSNIKYIVCNTEDDITISYYSTSTTTNDQNFMDVDSDLEDEDEDYYFNNNFMEVDSIS